MKPILKWAGGKNRMWKYIEPKIPNNIKTYYEPFFGSGAIYLKLKFERAVINDINSELMNIYKSIKVDANKINQYLKFFKEKDSKEFFLDLRKMDRSGELNKKDRFFRAARTIYLNKTCYGGLYRVNLKGFFNVPYANKINGKEILNIKNNELWSLKLNKTKTIILNKDFEKIIDESKKGDFIFVDPPYFKWSDTANFTSYTKEGFGEDEQKRLRRSLVKADERGVKFLLTNSGTEEVKKFYKVFSVKKVPIVRTIARSKNKKGFYEYIITNF